MAAHDFKIDLSQQYVITTSASDANVALPTTPKGTLWGIANRSGSWWLMTVTGTSAYINIGSAATSSNVLFPIGAYWPLYIPDGSTIHALGTSAGGQVGFVRANLSGT